MVTSTTTEIGKERFLLTRLERHHSTMTLNRIGKALVVAAVISLASIVISRNALAIVQNSRPFRDATIVVPVGGNTGSLEGNEVAFPKFQISSLYGKEHVRIDKERSLTRCARYNLKPYDGPQRRVFFGAMVADENWQVHLIHAVEVYGIYHAAVFVKSNTTHMATPRQLRYKDSTEGDLLTRSEMFGPETQVYLDLWLEDKPELLSMNRESEQRNTIIKRWKDARMLPLDVGIMADVDEFFSRDFLRAIQTCDFPALRPDPSCKLPKIVPAATSFEISPYCIKKGKWFHPDAISGQCVEGIGDPTERVIPLRTHERKYGERHALYGKTDFNNYPEAALASGRYPLFNGPDIRTVKGSSSALYNYKNKTGDGSTAAYGVAYHLHNWFVDFSLVRNKYTTYAHGDSAVGHKALAQIAQALDMTVRCVRGLGNDASPHEKPLKYYTEGRITTGPRPIFFLNTTYTEERHRLTQEMVRIDEEEYGSSYDSDGNLVVTAVALKTRSGTTTK